MTMKLFRTKEKKNVIAKKNRLSAQDMRHKVQGAGSNNSKANETEELKFRIKKKKKKK